MSALSILDSFDSFKSPPANAVIEASVADKRIFYSPKKQPMLTPCLKWKYNQICTTSN